MELDTTPRAQRVCPPDPMVSHYRTYSKYIK